MDDNPATHTEAAQHLAAAGRHVGQRTPPARPSVEARLGDLERTVKALAGTVGQLANIVSRVAAPAASPAPTGRIAAASDELVDWVAWLIRRYEITSTIPDCWAQHGALVEELDALRIAWHTTTGNGATQWHDQLDRALARIDSRWRTCTDQHRANTLPPWVTPHDPDPPPLDLAAGRTDPASRPTPAE